METLGLACSDNHRVHTLEAIADQRPRLLLHMLWCLWDRTAPIRTPSLFWDVTWQSVVAGYRRFGWDVTWQSVVAGYRRFGTINRLHLRGSSTVIVKFLDFLTLEDENDRWYWNDGKQTPNFAAKCPSRATPSTRPWRKPQSCTFPFCSSSSLLI